MFAYIATTNAQDEAPAKAWTFKTGLGFDFAQLLQIQPRKGAGENRIGFGGNANFAAEYKKNRLEWINSANMLLGLQRLGAAKKNNAINPFVKSADQFIVRSNFSFDVKENSKFAYWAGAELNTLLTPTFPGNTLTDVTGTGLNPISKFMAPASFVGALGINYKPNDDLRIRYSPAAVKMIIVADDTIANTPNAAGTAGTFGNPWRANGDYDKVDVQVGSFLNANYVKRFLPFNTKNAKGEEVKAYRLSYTSNLNLFTNYLKDPEQIDVDWQNSLDIMIIKGLSIQVLGNLFYDYDFEVQKGFDETTNEPIYGKGVSFTEQILIKYNLVF